MSDLISRSELLKRLEEWNTSDKTDKALYNFALHIIIEQPTAYSVEKVVEELEEKARTVNVIGYGTIYEAINKDVAIEIVKHGGVSDDVCEWESTQINNEWKPSCEPNSTYNVFGVAWFKRCPYCGKKIKVVE